MALRLMGFRFFRPTICSVCQKNETAARRELWGILNASSNEEQKTRQGDDSDEGESDYNSDENEGDQSAIIGQMLEDIKKNDSENSVVETEIS